MKKLIRQLWQNNRLLLIAFTVAAALTLFFAIRTAAFFIYWSNHQNVEIEGWMTIGYVAHSYRVPPPELQKAMGYDPHRPERRPLGRIARDTGEPLPRLIARVERAIETARQAMQDRRP